MMEPLPALGQILESTAADIGMLDASMKSLVSELAAASLAVNDGNTANKPSADSILQKYRQMTMLFIVKLMNHLVVVNNLKMPCSSCANTLATDAPLNNATTIQPPKLNALTTDTISALSPLLAAAASALTPPGSGGNCSTDSSSLLAAVPRQPVEEPSSKPSAAENSFPVLLAQQKLAALVQIHQQQRQQKNLPASAEASGNDAANARVDNGEHSDEHFDDDDDDDDDEECGDGGSGDDDSIAAATSGGTKPSNLLEVSADGEQPIDFSSASSNRQSSAQNRSGSADENRPPVPSSSVSSKPDSESAFAAINVHSQHSIASTGSTSIANNAQNHHPAVALGSGGLEQSIGSAFAAPANSSSNALSDALGRVVNRLPGNLQLPSSLLNLNPNCQPGSNDLTAAYANFQSAIASAVTSGHRNSIGGMPTLPPVKQLALGQPGEMPTNSTPSASQLAAIAQLFPANSAASSLLSPAIAGLVQKVTASSSSVSPATPAPPQSGDVLQLPNTASSAAPSTLNVQNRRASLPPYMLSSHHNSPSMVSPSAIANSQSGNATLAMPGSAGVRTADRYRVVYTSSQTFELEQEYRQNKFITITRKKELARQLGLNERQVKIWFQNRRAKDKRAHRRGAGGELDQSGSRMKKLKGEPGAIKEEYQETGSAGSSASSSAPLHHDGNSNSYDGSMQAHQELGGGHVDDSDVDCDEVDSGDELNDEDAGEQGGQMQQQLTEQAFSAFRAHQHPQGLALSQGLLQTLQQQTKLPSLLSAFGSGTPNGPNAAVNLSTVLSGSAMEIN